MIATIKRAIRTVNKKPATISLVVSGAWFAPIISADDVVAEMAIIFDVFIVLLVTV